MARQDIKLDANTDMRNDIIQAVRLLKQAYGLLAPARDNMLQLIDGTDYKAVSTELQALDGGVTPVDAAAHSAFGQVIYNIVNGAVADMDDGDMAALRDRFFE